MHLNCSESVAQRRPLAAGRGGRANRRERSRGLASVISRESEIHGHNILIYTDSQARPPPPCIEIPEVLVVKSDLG
jgi:hypothetical protein